MLDDLTMEREAREGAAISTELPGAMKCGELELHFHPKIDLASGALAGVEGLLRWPRPPGSAVPASRLIEIAELTEVIVPLGRWVLGQACRHAAHWRALGLGPLRIAVNVSAVQAQILRDERCDEAQGFYFSRPLHAEDLPSFIRSL